MVEMGHSKNGTEEDIFNYSIAYDRNNQVPLYYESSLEIVLHIF